VYTVLAFGGFEGATPLAEESRDPKRTVQKAVLLATLGIGVFYVFTTYAAAVAFGPDKFATFTSSGASSWQGMAKNLYGLFWFFVFLAVVNSTIANANAGVNISSRISFAMGRIHAFPAALARVHPTHRSPVLAIVLSFALTIAVTLGLGLHYNPVNAFAMTGTGIVIVLVAIYILMNVACIGYFAQAANRGGRRWNPFLHLIVPLLGIAAFVPAWLTSAGIKVFSFVVPLSPPASYMGPGVAGFMVLGVIYLGYLYARHPQRVTEVGLVHLDEPAATTGTTTSAPG
jgi:amino acid transporter